MEVNYSPAKIYVFKEFPVTPGEITITLKRSSDSTGVWYIHGQGVIRNNRFIPVGKLEVHSESGKKNEYGRIVWSEEGEIELLISIELDELAYTNPSEEYTICLQAENKAERFPWMDAIIEDLIVFKMHSKGSDDNVERLNHAYERILRSPPEKIISVPFTVHSLVKSKETLCLDFGTSYSVCAAYIPGSLSKDLILGNKLEVNKINFNLFTDLDGNESKLEPTKLLLCSYDPETKKKLWAYGYDAEQIAKTKLGKATYLLGIKIMLGDLEKEITCYDIEGNALNLTYEDILTEYLNYLINSSKKYFGIDFKNVHVSTPVLYTIRQREAYEKILKKIGIEKIEAKLDEAKSPLYFFLSTRINNYLELLTKSDDIPNYGTIKYFVIDCGGGSTDATLINNITLKQTNDGTNAIDLNFSDIHVVGNPFFGGQTLTLYLFKYLKWILTNQLRHDDSTSRAGSSGYPIDTLLDHTDNEIFWHLYKMEDEFKTEPEKIAEEQKNEVYGKLEESYNKIESVIPTRFMDFQNRDKKSYFSVYENFNLIWQLAEAIKVKIYGSDAHIIVKLSELEQWNHSNGIWCQKDDSSAHEYIKNVFDHVSVCTYELNKIYRPIIFIEISRLFRNLDIDSSSLLDKSLFVRFVGQTTRIPLFDESLAYHIPRKVIENDQKGAKTDRFTATKAEDKKLCTASGAAQYLRHVLSGKVVDNQFTHHECLMYDIYRFDDDAETLQKKLIPRKTRIEDAERCYLRPQAEHNEDFIGYRFEEYKIFLGTVNFDLDKITRKLTQEEVDRLTEKHAESKKLEEGRNIIVVIKVVNVEYAQKMEFRPHIMKNGQFCTTEQPVELKFQSDSMFSRNFILNGEI